MVKPIKMGVGSPLGDGNQYVPWIHLEDISDAYVFAIENSSLAGAYNVAAPEGPTNRQLTHSIAKVLNKKLWAPKVPAFVLNALFGEMARIVLTGSRVDGSLFEQKGFNYQFKSLESALKDILK
jgi:NAD dependent epimerase/dehydratase family enzyme